MKNKSIIVSAVVIICAGLFSSCISIDRKIKINRDGSGNETMKITFNKEFYTMMASMSALMDSSRRQGFLDSLYSDEIFMNKTKTEYDSIAGIVILDISASINEDSSKNFIIRYDFDSVQKTGSSFTQIKETDTSSTTKVTWTKDGDEILFRYLYEQKEMQNMDSDDSLGQTMKSGLSEMFGKGLMNVEIEFPYNVIESNAKITNGNTLQWNYTLSDLIMNSRMILEARMRE